MSDLKNVFKENYLKYASYVILDRAIPDVVDGLKPVQRRILWTLHQMDDGKLHKVANVSGQTMALHPHGDAPINEALINLASKGFLLDKQGNFGNPATGDPAAASRYIETRLNALAKETLFNDDLTPTLPSYDGRTTEPVTLPAKIPLLLMQGAEGIAVGMATKILPHNFKELLEAEIAMLEGTPYKILPDFPFGGVMDASEYALGAGKVKLRAKMEVVDDKTIVIREICHGTTTESLIRSIDEAAKKGKIKIDSINDYTAEKIEIEIKLPRGQYANTTLDALYAFTECEVSVNSQVLVIRDNLPWETTVDEILRHHVELLLSYLKKELEIERDLLINKIFEKSLEEIFIEHRLYKKIEEINSYEKIHDTIQKSLEPFQKSLVRVPTHEDREKLLSIPLRRISRFDIEKNKQEIEALDQRLIEIEKHLKNVRKFTIAFIKDLIKKYGSLFPRRTKLQEIEELDVKELAKKKVKLGFDEASGYFGLKVANGIQIECTNYDKILIFYRDGTYKVINIPEKEYLLTSGSEVVFIGVADKETEISVLYKDEKTHFPYSKKFIVKQFILEKEYRYLEEGQKLEFISSEKQATVQLHFKPKPKQKVSTLEFNFSEVPVKGVATRGIRVVNKELKAVKVVGVK